MGNTHWPCLQTSSSTLWEAHSFSLCAAWEPRSGFSFVLGRLQSNARCCGLRPFVPVRQWRGWGRKRIDIWGLWTSASDGPSRSSTLRFWQEWSPACAIWTWVTSFLLALFLIYHFYSEILEYSARISEGAPGMVILELGFHTMLIFIWKTTSWLSSRIRKMSCFERLEEPLCPSTHWRHVYIAIVAIFDWFEDTQSHTRFVGHKGNGTSLHHLTSCFRLLILSLYIRLVHRLFTLKNVAFVFFTFQCPEFNCVRTLWVKKTDLVCASATCVMEPMKTVASIAPTSSVVAPKSQRPRITNLCTWVTQRRLSGNPPGV